ncbi:MAG: CPBP family intramembrane metalloprotease [Anaerolineae bacterium]|nr:CPBP family intramembrane metalloprotease [Anaerolineae bacterium]
MFLIGLVVFGLLLAAIYIANVRDATRTYSVLLDWILLAIAGLNLLLGTSALLSSRAGNSPAISVTDGGAAFVLAAVTSGLAIAAITAKNFRLLLKRIVGGSGSYDPDSNTHLAAFVIALVGVSVNLIMFIIGGGIEGLASEISNDGITLDGVVFQQVIWIALAVFGVGLWIRRGLPQVIERLGLNTITLRNIVAGLIGATACIAFLLIAGIVMQLVIGTDTVREQQAASQALTGQFNSLSMALIVAVTVGIGEETLFRGAIQPVFGNGLTSLLFTVIHTQYAFTPATLIIFVVSLALGYLRQHYGTTSSIVAHATYNFFQLAAAVLIGNALMGGGS